MGRHAVRKGQSGQAEGIGGGTEQGRGTKIELKTDRSVICVLRVGRDRDVCLRDRICGGVQSSVIVLGKEPLSGFANCALHSRKETCVNSGGGRQTIIQRETRDTCTAARLRSSVASW